MRHRNHGRKLGLKSAHRNALLRQLVEALFLHGRIRTTVTRAKEARPIAERIITWAKKGTLHHRRLAFAVIYRRDIVNRIFDHMAAWYRNRQGGYTRIIKIGQRMGDGAPVAFLELLDWVPGTEKLIGQNMKQEKPVEGEEGLEGKDKEKDKEKKEKKAKEAKEAAKKAKAPKPEEKKSKVAKDPAKEKKKAERKAAEEKRKQERAAHREKTKKEVISKKEEGKKAESKKAEVKKAEPKKAEAKKAKPAKGKEKK
jgi:large subunit ribosomal protein L17